MITYSFSFDLEQRLAHESVGDFFDRKITAWSNVDDMSGFASGGSVYHLDDVVQLNTVITESIDGGSGKRRLIKMSLGGSIIVIKNLLTD